MGMSTHIQAFIPDTDPEYQKHKKVLLVCQDASVSLPEETAKYFGTKYADDCVLEEKLEINLKQGTHYKHWNDDSRSGFEIDIDKLPKGVTKVRFYNSW